MTTITLPIDPALFWLVVTLGGIILLGGLIYAALPPAAIKPKDPLVPLKATLGAEKLGDGVFITLMLFWAALALSLFVGLLWMIWQLIWHAPPISEVDQSAARFAFIRLAALTATLAATVALPFTLIRLRLINEQTQTANEQTQTAKASLFNEKITEAAADLHAQRQVSKEIDGKWKTFWEDDITRRNTAIDRLEGLVREEPNEAERVSRLLSVYVRELSDEFPAQIAPDTDVPQKLRKWARNLSIPRSDMQNAVQVLGRLAAIKWVDRTDLAIDLRAANLQMMNLKELNFEEAQLSNAELQGADLSNAELQGANLSKTGLQEAVLSGAELQGADLSNAELQRANLINAKLQGANLSNAGLQEADLTWAELQGAFLSRAGLHAAFLSSAGLQGANLSGAEFGSSTLLTETVLTGVSVKSVDFTAIPQINNFLDDIYGDGTTKLPKGTPWPEHWPTEELDYGDFRTKWRAWAATKGVDIPK